jgi:hypothetical protein
MAGFYDRNVGRATAVAVGPPGIAKTLLYREEVLSREKLDGIILIPRR